MNFPIAMNRTLSLRTYFDVTEKHLRALHSLGEKIEQKQLLSIMKSKLPRNIISKLEEQKDENDEWTVETFRNRLKRCRTAQEAGDQQLRLYHSKNKNIFRTNVNSPSLSGSPMRYAGEALMSNEFSLPHKSSKCIFCDGRHWSDECRNFPDVLSRKRRLKKRCSIYLKEGHLAKEFKLQNKICVHYGEKKKHHRSLCPKKFK